MTQEEADETIRKLLPIVQKFRSNSREAVEKYAPDGTNDNTINMALEGMFPWIFDDKKLMGALNILSNRIEDGGHVTGMEFYNLMYIFDSFESDAKAAIEIAFQIELPLPNTQWAIGFQS